MVVERARTHSHKHMDAQQNEGVDGNGRGGAFWLFR